MKRDIAPDPVNLSVLLLLLSLLCCASIGQAANPAVTIEHIVTILYYLLQFYYYYYYMLSPLVNVEAIFLLGRLLHGSRIILINYLLYHTPSIGSFGTDHDHVSRKESNRHTRSPCRTFRAECGKWDGECLKAQADQTRKPEHKKKASETTSKRAPPTNRVAIASNIMGNIFAYSRGSGWIIDLREKINAR